MDSILNLKEFDKKRKGAEAPLIYFAYRIQMIGAAILNS